MDGDGNGNGDLWARAAILTHPGSAQGRRHRVTEQILERFHHRFESGAFCRTPRGTAIFGKDAVVPLDPFPESRAAQVGASYIGHAVSQDSERTVKDVGLGVEVTALAPKHSELDVLRSFIFEVEDTVESVGLGDSEVVAGEKAQASAPLQKLAEMLKKSVDAALENEGDDQIGSGGAIEVSQEMRQKRVVFPADERSAMGRLERFGGEE